jgi:hypothetical protein
VTPLEFHEAVMRYCALAVASVTSSGRTWEHNRKVGGVDESAHLFWLAADVVYDGKPPVLGAQWAERLGLKLIREDDHDHLQPLDWKAG